MRPRSLRLRLTLAFGLGATFLSLLLASIAYIGARHILVTQRQTTDLRQAYVNAALVRDAINSGSPTLSTLMRSLDSATSSTSVVDVSGLWYTQTATTKVFDMPYALRHLATLNEVSRQVVVNAGTPTLYIDVPIPTVKATYYQLDNLTDLDTTLRNVLFILAASTVLTTGLGVLGGWRLIRRSMEPLEVASRTAQLVAGGALDTRIPEEMRNVEVATLATSFNLMVDQLVDRLRRDARFAGDVSHELRSPLTTIATTIEVLRHSRDQLTPDGRAAFDLLATDVKTFQVLVEDLLEIARSDAGVSSMHIETLPIEELVRQCVLSAQRRLQLRPVPIVAATGPAVFVHVDRRRFERVITNLLDNAERYAGGATTVRITPAPDAVVLDVDDAGPGVNPDDRVLIFDRFYRGSAAHARGEARGTGLGLALVADHVAQFGGTVTVGSSPDGGARFRITLPVVKEVEE